MGKGSLEVLSVTIGSCRVLPQFRIITTGNQMDTLQDERQELVREMGNG
jgi:hypothetical protein